MTAVCTAARHNSLAAGQPTLIYYRTSGRVHDFGAAVKLASLRLRKYRACFIKCGTDTKQIPRLPPQAHQMRVRSRRSLGMTTIAKRARETRSQQRTILGESIPLVALRVSTTSFDSRTMRG